MKKMIVILVLVALAAIPATAGVTLSGTVSGSVATIKYSQSNTPGDSNNIARAFALDITVNNSKHITAVSCSGSPGVGYYIYPGSITIASGSVSNYGSCICNSTQYPYPAGTGIGTPTVTVEMGSLYTGSSIPASSGTLLTFTVDGTPCTATITGNTARAGVVMENPDASSGFTSLTLVIGASPPPPCYAATRSDYAQWVTLGSPSCWCFPRQCHGDINGQMEVIGKSTVAVGYADLNLFLAAWQSNDVCSDLDHNTEVIGKTTVRVGYNDLNILLANWQGTPATDCNN